MKVMDESNTITHVLAGDAEAYRELVERYQTGLIIHCENMMKDREEAKDIAQQAFIKAYSNLNTFSRQKAKFSTWLYRIATNLCVDELRRNKRRVHVKNIESLAEAHEPVYLEADEKRFIQKVILELEPPKYGEIIRAYFWEGKSYQEIAASYNTSTNTIGTWMRRAKAQLREKLS